MTASRIGRIAFIIIMTAALYLLITNPAETAPAPTECETWAYAEGEDNYPDSIIMHTIGCDNDGSVGGTYYRAEGRCAYVARDAYRNHGLAANSQELVDHMQARNCATFEDGTYDDLETNGTDASAHGDLTTPMSRSRCAVAWTTHPPLDKRNPGTYTTVSRDEAEGGTNEDHQ